MTINRWIFWHFKIGSVFHPQTGWTESIIIKKQNGFVYLAKHRGDLNPLIVKEDEIIWEYV